MLQKFFAIIVSFIIPTALFSAQESVHPIKEACTMLNDISQQAATFFTEKTIVIEVFQNSSAVSDEEKKLLEALKKEGHDLFKLTMDALGENIKCVQDIHHSRLTKPMTSESLQDLKLPTLSSLQETTVALRASFDALSLWYHRQDPLSQKSLLAIKSSHQSYLCNIQATLADLMTMKKKFDDIKEQFVSLQEKTENLLTLLNSTSFNLSSLTKHKPLHIMTGLIHIPSLEKIRIDLEHIHQDIKDCLRDKHLYVLDHTSIDWLQQSMSKIQEPDLKWATLLKQANHWRTTIHPLCAQQKERDANHYATLCTSLMSFHARHEQARHTLMYYVSILEHYKIQ